MRLKATILTIAFLFFVSAGLVMAKRQDSPGAVYTMTNSKQGNEVLVFDRSADGSLSPAGAFETEGLGTGGGLGNQGAVLLTSDNQWLYVVNAGSNTISVFRVKPGALELMGSVDSGGMQPVSLTVDGDLLYVLNAGGAVDAEDNITGFMIEPDGMLQPLAGSTRPLSAADTSPAQIGFSTDGNVLVVAEKDTSKIDTYVVDDDGRIRLRQIRTGRALGDDVVVLSGLEQGERVALDPIAAGVALKAQAEARRAGGESEHG